jgi:hypothetical protein
MRLRGHVDQPMSAFRKLLVAATLLVALLVAPASALAAKPTTGPADTGATGKKCWNALIRDWYDGRIDKTYPVHCYRDALKHLPQDVRTYSDAYDVISRALADATRGEKTPDPDQPVPPPAGTETSTTTGSTTTGSTTTTAVGPVGNDGPGSASGGPIGGVLNGGDQGADGVPIPLLVLAGLALLLVAAGGAGLLARRIQARRAQP